MARAAAATATVQRGEMLSLCIVCPIEATYVYFGRNGISSKQTTGHGQFRY